MILLELAGIKSVETEDDLAKIGKAARQFVRAGGTVDLVTWAQLSVPERAALIEARELGEVRLALMFGKAAQGGLSALDVLTEIDGGKAHDDAMLLEVARKIAEGSNAVS